MFGRERTILTVILAQTDPTSSITQISPSKEIQLSLIEVNYRLPNDLRLNSVHFL